MTLIFSALLFVFASCENAGTAGAFIEDGKGLVDLSLSSEITIKNTESISEDYSDYNFRYVGVDGYGTSDYYRYGDVSWPMEWYFGTFRLQAESCTRDEAEQGRGKWRYEGTGTPFAVVNGQTAASSVVCGVANVRVNVIFEDNMFVSFKDFKLEVTSVLAPQYDEDDNLVSEERAVRTLEYNPLNTTGFYNLHDAPMNLKYTLSIKEFGVEEYIEHLNGYLVKDGSGVPAELVAGDDITLRVKYTGETVVLPGLIFIVNGEWTTDDVIGNDVSIEDYTGDTVTED